MRTLAKLCIGFLLMGSTAGCSFNSREVYSVEYQANDIPGITILDYQYTKGDKVIVGVSPSIKNSSSFHGVYGLGSTGGYERGDSLFVKWRVDVTGDIKSETVDLTKILPSVLQDKKLSFIVEPDGLNIYIASPTVSSEIRCVKLSSALRQPRQADLVAMATYCNRSLLKIYPQYKQLLD